MILQTTEKTTRPDRCIQQIEEQPSARRDLYLLHCNNMIDLTFCHEQVLYLIWCSLSKAICMPTLASFELIESLRILSGFDPNF